MHGGHSPATGCLAGMEFAREAESCWSPGSSSRASIRWGCCWCWRGFLHSRSGSGDAGFHPRTATMLWPASSQRGDRDISHTGGPWAAGASDGHQLRLAGDLGADRWRGALSPCRSQSHLTRGSGALRQRRFRGGHACARYFMNQAPVTRVTVAFVEQEGQEGQANQTVGGTIRTGQTSTVRSADRARAARRRGRGGLKLPCTSGRTARRPCPTARPTVPPQALRSVRFDAMHRTRAARPASEKP